MFKPLPVFRSINREFVVRGVSVEMMNKPVFDQFGKKIGKIVRIMGPVNDPMAVVAINDQTPVDGDKLFVKV